jgi:hypothetical protein
MTAWPTRPEDKLATAAHPGIEVRTYKNDQAMAVDAATMAAAGWRIAGQVSRKSGGGVGMTLGIALVVIGVLLYIPLVILGLVLMLGSYLTRSSETVVTYQHPEVAATISGG